MNYCFELKLHSRFCFVLNSTKQNLTVWTAVGSLAMDPTAVHMLVLCIESHVRCDCRLPNVIFPSRQRHSVVNLVCNLPWVSGNHSASSFCRSILPLSDTRHKHNHVQRIRGDDRHHCDERGRGASPGAGPGDLPDRHGEQHGRRATAAPLRTNWRQDKYKTKQKKQPNTPLYSAFTKLMSLICYFTVCMKLTFFCRCPCHWRNVLL